MRANNIVMLIYNSVIIEKIQVLYGWLGKVGVLDDRQRAGGSFVKRRKRSLANGASPYQSRIPLKVQSGGCTREEMDDISRATLLRIQGGGVSGSEEEGDEEKEDPSSSVFIIDDPPTNKSYGGLCWAFAAAFSTSLGSLLVKKSTAPPGQISFLGFLTILVVSLPIALWRGENLFPKDHRLALVAHSVTSSPVLIASYQAVRLMPLADEAVLAYSSIVFTVVLARIYLKEPCGFVDIAVSLGVVLGVILLSQPVLHADNYPNYSIGAVLALSAALSDSLSFVFARRLASLHCSVVLLGFSLATVPVSALLSLYEDWGPPSVSMIPLVFLTSVQEFLVTKALLEERAGLVALVQSADVVFAYTWELALFHEKYSSQRVLGAALVASMVLVSAFNH